MEAWVKREGEQQTLLASIMDEARAAADEGENDYHTFFRALSLDLIGCLMEQRLAGRVESLGYLHLNCGDQLIAGHLAKFREAVRRFSRTVAEEEQLLARLLGKCVEIGCSDIQAEYLRQSVHEPEKLYEGRRAMDEVVE